MARIMQIPTRRRRALAPEVESPRVTHEAIAQVAYELFERRGGVHGFDQQDWFEAECLLQEGRWKRATM